MSWQHESLQLHVVYLNHDLCLHLPWTVSTDAAKGRR